MALSIGLDALARDDFRVLLGKSIGVVCNQSTVDSNYVHLLDHLRPLHQKGQLKLSAVFGPQHGLFGHTQDNMIEWEGSADEVLGFRTYSLYGKERKPTPEMLQGVELLVIDLPDIGSRYYTFQWTMGLCMEAAAELGISVLVLDRPNPINGVSVEGPLLDLAYRSFVGNHRVPVRTGITLGEMATYINGQLIKPCELTVQEVDGWDRKLYGDQTGAPWAMPSPNMPIVETAVVYPGGCLLEATNLSEGRGTTRPFEMFGAPFVDGWRLADALNSLRLPGVFFRPVQFEPTFNKYAKKVCEGCFVHVTDRTIFRPFFTYASILQLTIEQTGLHEAPGENDSRFVADSRETDLPGFAWKQPPYEYEHLHLPIDILAGSDNFRLNLEQIVRFNASDSWAEDEGVWQKMVKFR